MKKDTRQLPPEIQQYNRQLVIRMYQQGISRNTIAETLGISYNSICIWIRAWENSGDEALLQGKRGRRALEQRLLNPIQEEKLQQVLRDKTPTQMQLPFALWGRKAIQAVIWQMWRIEIAERTLTDYLKRWEFTPQKPLKRAYEQNPKAIEKWHQETYPAIKKKAAEEAAEIWWGDETGLKNTCQHSRGFAPKGKTPVIDLNAKRFSINMISAINNRGSLRFMLYKETMTAKKLLQFFQRLIKEAGRKVYLILDNLRVHHAKVVRCWLEKYKSRIEVFYLPPYSPELNPDEYLNGDLKSALRHSSPARNQQELEKKTKSHLRKLQRRNKHVARF
ncbi:IS630 family transposase, partial [Xenorhabdus indica]